jgi:hypothetical protein
MEYDVEKEKGKIGSDRLKNDELKTICYLMTQFR